MFFSQTVSPLIISNREIPAIPQELQEQEISPWLNSATRAWDIIISLLWKQPFLKFLVCTFPSGIHGSTVAGRVGMRSRNGASCPLSMSRHVAGTSWEDLTAMLVHVISLQGLPKTPNLLISGIQVT